MWLGDEENTLALTDGENPFVVEAQLYCKDENVSVSIKNVDGKYIVKRYNLTELDKEQDIACNPQDYLPNRMENVEKIQLVQYWRAEPDELCENIKSLQPAELVFKGFILKK